MITLFYQTPSTDFCIPNSIPYHLRSEDACEFKSVKPRFITEICNYLNIQYKQVTKETWKGEPAYYHIELEWIDQSLIYRNVFEWIDKDVLELLKDPNSNLRLLIWFPNEGFSLSMPRFIEIIDFCLKDLNIPGNKTYFVFGDINIGDNFQKYQRKLSLREIHVYGFDSFETTYHNECRMLESMGHANMFPREQDRISNLNKIRDKRFIFRNANPREHRLYFATELKSRNLLEKSYYSWLNRYYVPKEKNYDWTIRKYNSDIPSYENLKNHMKEFIDNSPYLIDHDAENIGKGLNQRFLQPQMFFDSYFTFVTETTFDNLEGENVLFLTEKIYQPILQHHPFIVAACPGMLAYMQKHGYQTFPELFDETYDQEQDLKKRTKMIINNIEHVSNMSIDQLHKIYYSASFQEKLVHNKKIFVEKKGKNKWEEAIKWLDR
jgi:hypothetical protein